MRENPISARLGAVSSQILSFVLLINTHRLRTSFSSDTKRTAMTSISISSLHVSPASAKAPISGERLNMTFTTQTLCLVCAAVFFSLRAVISPAVCGNGGFGWREGKREASGEKVGHLTNFQKNTGSVCFFVFLCIKRLNFSSSAVRQGMHGRQESKFFPLTFLYRDELFSDSISNKYATHLISFLPPSCNPSICARRQVSAFHQVNTPISSDNDTGKEGHNLNFQCLETVQHKLGEDSHFCSWCLLFFFPS